MLFAGLILEAWQRKIALLCNPLSNGVVYGCQKTMGNLVKILKIRLLEYLHWLSN